MKSGLKSKFKIKSPAIFESAMEGVNRTNLIGGDVVNALGAAGDVGEDGERHLLHFRTTLEPEERKQQPEVADALNVGA